MDYGIIAFVLLVLIIIAVFVILVKPKKMTEEQKKQFGEKFYAHRGLYKQEQTVPENSATAFKLAMRKGYGIELDVRLTKDKQVVVFHDEGLKRACKVEKTKVRKLTYEELQSYELFGTREKIPLLSQVLEETEGSVPLLINMRCTAGEQAQAEEIAEKTYEVLKDYGGNCAVASTEPAAVAWFKRNAPEILRGMISGGYREKSKRLSGFQRFMRRNLFYNCKVSPHFISCDISETDAVGLKLCKSIMKVPIVGWTAREEFDTAKLREYFDVLCFEFYEPKA